MIFLINIDLKVLWNFLKGDFYYDILGFVLSFFENDEQIYNNILKISYIKTKEGLKVQLSIYWKENLKRLLDFLANNKWKIFSLDNIKFSIDYINLDFQIFDLLKQINEIKPLKYKSFWIKFLSPTMIRNKNKIFLLPQPERFLLNPLTKLYNFLKKEGLVEKIHLFKNFDFAIYKLWLKDEILVKSFNIKTKIVDIKGSKRAGTIWNVEYIVYKDENEDFLKILNLTLNFVKFSWIGSGTRLGFWNVKVFWR